MKPVPLLKFFILITLLCLSCSGCRNVAWWKKDESKPQQNSVMMKDADVMTYNDFRTIDASMMEPSEKTKKNQSILWENSQARDIERRLGVTPE